MTFYRHGGKEAPDMVVGTVEEAGRQSERKFTSMEELYRLLGEAGEKWKRTGRKKTGNSREDR